MNQLQQAVRRGIEESPSLLYRTARYVLADQHEAEDAAQEAALDALRAAGQYDPERPIGPWLAGLAYRRAVARLRRKGVRMRLEREAAPPNSAATPPPHLAAERDESADLVRRKVQALEQEARTLVALHYFEGFSLREIGRILDLPDSTVGDRLKSALNQLRTALAGAGLALATPATLEAALRSVPVEPVPSGLVVKLKDLASSKGPAMAGAPKGGLVMKIGFSLAAAGLVAGGVFWAVGGNSQESAKPPEKIEKPRKFATPVTDPGAEWERDPKPFAGMGLTGNLDGARQGTLAGNSPGLGRHWSVDGADCVLREYDPTTERYFTVAGSSYGYLDGPFSRARFRLCGTGGSYVGGLGRAVSPDGRYMYLTEPPNKGALRRLDFEKEEVTTILKETKGAIGLAADAKGNVYIVGWNWARKVHPDGKSEPLNLETLDKLTGHGFCIVFDDKNNRIYGANRGNQEFRAEGEGRDWYIGYWDLNAGGKFAGVLPQPRKGEKTRPRKESGPFEGTNLHCPAGIAWGPDDPDRRFLYYGGGDDSSFYRLDLEKKNFVTFGSPGKDASRSDRGRAAKNCRFGETKDLPGKYVTEWCGVPAWDSDGNMYFSESHMGMLTRYTRTK